MRRLVQLLLIAALILVALLVLLRDTAMPAGPQHLVGRREAPHDQQDIPSHPEAA